MKPGNSNLDVYRGSDVSYEIRVDPTALNLAGMTGAAKMRATWDTTIEATFGVAINDAGQPTQNITLSLPHTISTDLPTAPTGNTAGKDIYWWDLELTDSLGKVLQFLRGQVTVYFESTR